MMRSVQTLVVAVVVLVVTARANVVDMHTDLRLVHGASEPMAVFRCTTGNDQMYYLRHMLTWSKIGLDGREHYLSVNWNVLPEAQVQGYKVAHQVYFETTPTHPNGTYRLYFILTRGALTADDQGEYVCRVHDMQRNLLAEQSVPIVVYHNDLAMYPYRVMADTGSPAAAYCLYNATGEPITNEIAVSHVTQDGVITKIAANGKFLNPSYEAKYDVLTSMLMGTKNTTIGLKAPTAQDNGYFVCELSRDSVNVATTKVKVIVGQPRLHVTPRFYLQMPVDSKASFECSCDVMNTDACVTHNLAWSLRDSKSGVRKFIYKDGSLKNRNLYSISKAQNGTSLILNISALSINRTEGDYICSLHDGLTADELTSVAVPTSVHPISINALVVMDKYPSTVRFLCLVGGTHWNSQYLQSHSLQWRHTAPGGATTHVMSENGRLGNGLDAKRFKVLFDAVRGYAVLDITNISDKDLGNYKCLLLSNDNRSILKEQTVPMLGEGNRTLVG